MITYDYDGVLTKEEIFQKFLDIQEKAPVMVVSSRDDTIENKREILKRVGRGIKINLCGGFLEKCTQLANVAGVFGKVIHFDDDPAVVEFFKSTDVDVKVRLIE